MRPDDSVHLSSELSRDLSLFHITMLGLGMMIGAGVFLGIGNSIFIAGPGGALLTFALNGVIAMFTAMSYAELSSAIPRAGGAYNFARVGFGRGTSFLAGWMEWFASSVAGSLYAVTFAIYTVRYLLQLGLLNWVPEAIPVVCVEKAMALLVACFFLYTNYRGASETGKIGAFFTLGQTAFLALIGVVGIVVAIKDPGRLANLKPFLPHGWSKLLITMGFTYVAFEGFEVISQAGDETIEPRRNLPKAMLYSVFIVTFTYVAAGFATLVAVKAGSHGLGGMAPWEWIGQFRERGFGEAVAQLMPAGNLLLTLAVIFASTSALNATIYSATRASYALGRDRMLPGFFSRISNTNKTPSVALLFTGILVISVATLMPTMDVASSASIMFLFLFFLVNVCVVRIRVNMSDELQYGFLMPLFPVFPIAAIIAQAVLAIWLVHMSWIAWIVAPAWILSGAGIYHLYSKSRAISTPEEIHVLEEEPAPEGDEYRVMVAVANPNSALGLVRGTYKLCGAKDAQVALLHMIQVPEQVPLSDAEQYMVEGRESVVETMMYLAPHFRLSSTIRYCRNVARGIISAVKEKKINLLVLGWHGRPRRHGFRLGTTLDPIIERSPSNIVIFKNYGNQEYKRILVPLAGGPNGAFALEVATILADPKEGEVDALTVAGQKLKFDLGNFVLQHRSQLHLPLERVHSRLLYSSKIAATILKESENYDLVVIGTSNASAMTSMTRETVPERVSRLCEKPLVMVKASSGIRSWIQRWV